MSRIFQLALLLVTVKFVSATIYSCSPSASCGCSTNSATMSRIVSGETASSQTWGWAVSLLINSNTLCGGSIISSSWVLTAAHCVNGSIASQIIVYAGSNTKYGSSQIRSVSSVTVHPSYSSTTFVNDIALLQLSSALNMADPAVSAICIPSVSPATLAAGEWPAAGTTVVAVGWGRLSEGGSTSSTLQQVSMQTVDRTSSKCTPVTSNWNYQMCASDTCKDTCQGDSGGPLMAFTASNQWVLVGVTSSGVGCARAQYAGSYTRVAAYQSWISTTTSAQLTNPVSSTLTSSTTELNSTLVCAATTIYSSSSFQWISLVLPLIVSIIIYELYPVY